MRNQQKREHMRGKADAAEEEDYATFLQQVLLDVMMTAIYCSISWNRSILMLLGPMPPYGRRTLTESSSQNTVWAGTFWGAVSFCASGTQLGFDLLTCFVIRHSSSVICHS